MTKELVGSIFIWLIVAIIVIAIIVYFLNWLYRRSTKQVAFVRTGFGGETNSDPHGVGEFSVETHSDDEDTTLPDGSVDLDLEDQSDGQFNSDVDISDPKNDQNTTT